MAARRRRKSLPLQRIAFPLTASLVVIVGLVALWLMLSQAWPQTARKWMARIAGERPASIVFSDAEKPEHPIPESLPPEAALKLKRENEILREENKRLRELLKQTSETLAAKTFQLEEMKLRRLIQDRTRNP
ncbi:MAG: hypothetical protein N3D11_10655 [Candidatus Sumerlaeia bacterium]|nr:hypothetical protein [Candidatus Sumerlaeia bacterium]